MMMRFTKLNDDMRDALLQFCFEQNELNGYTEEGEIETLVESAFEVLKKPDGTSLPVTPIYRYNMYAGEQFTGEILPDDIKENGIICRNAVMLGTFTLDTYTANTEEDRAIVRGYDVYYDIDSEEICLIYRVVTTDDSVTTIYRVDTDVYEDFDVYEFVISISAQLMGKLKQSLSVPMMITIKEAA